MRSVTCSPKFILAGLYIQESTICYISGMKAYNRNVLLIRNYPDKMCRGLGVFRKEGIFVKSVDKTVKHILPLFFVVKILVVPSFSVINGSVRSLNRLPHYLGYSVTTGCQDNVM